jgi:ribosome-binding protein aMBF1 (putative translation factor)
VSIRSARKKAGLAQWQLALILGVDQGCISNWETGKTHPTWERLKTLKKVLKCTADELLEEDE